MMKLQLLSLYCLCSSVVFSQQQESLYVKSSHNGPVIDHTHPDVLASNNKSGFETGQMIKEDGAYHLFINEMFGRSHRDMRIAYWTSTDAVNWKRVSTLVESIPGRSPSNVPG